jgi:hypothetical protein
VNPGPTWGAIAVFAAYTVVLGALLIFVALMSAKKKKLERRRTELRKSG